MDYEVTMEIEENGIKKMFEAQLEIDYDSQTETVEEIVIEELNDVTDFDNPILLSYDDLSEVVKLQVEQSIDEFIDNNLLVIDTDTNYLTEEEAYNLLGD